MTHPPPPGDPLQAALAAYVASGGDAHGQAARVLRLVAEGCEVLDRMVPLHVTASALPVDPWRGRLALHWHRKIGRWLQLGGHAEPGERDPAVVARREAEEESGLALAFFPDPERPVVVHVDVVPVPAVGGEPAHHHADVRYLLAPVDLSADPAGLRPGPGAEPLRWCGPEEALALAGDAGLRTFLCRAAGEVAAWRAGRGRLARDDEPGEDA